MRHVLQVGKRFIQSDGDHYYTGYPGSSMTFEYNTECHYGAVSLPFLNPPSPTVHLNSLALFL